MEAGNLNKTEPHDNAIIEMSGSEDSIHRKLAANSKTKSVKTLDKSRSTTRNLRKGR